MGIVLCMLNVHVSYGHSVRTFLLLLINNHVCYSKGIDIYMGVLYKMNIWWQFNLVNQSFLSDWWILYWRMLLYYTCIGQ